MKTDAPLPARVPTKRAQIGRLADLHIAIWLAGDAITENERSLLEREKERRKQGRRTVTLGVLAPVEGLTPAQRRNVREWQSALEPCTLVGLGADWRETAKEATHLIACPRSSRVSPTMSEAIKLARRRNVGVRVVYPDGREG